MNKKPKVEKKEKIEYVKKNLHTKNHKKEMFKTIRVKRTDNKSVKEADIKNYLNDLVDNHGFDLRDMAVSAMGVTNDFTLKYFGKLEFYDTTEYYKDKVEHVDKFDNYDYFDVTLRMNI
jgi:hypothetical protein